MRVSVILFVLLVVLSLITTGSNVNPWDIWYGHLRAQCPANHVDWISDGGQLDLLEALDRTLPPGAREEASFVADASHRCSAEKMGFYCEMYVSLDAYNKLGVLNRFVAFACHRYNCTEAALCTVADP